MANLIYVSTASPKIGQAIAADGNEQRFAAPEPLDDACGGRFPAIPADPFLTASFLLSFGATAAVFRSTFLRALHGFPPVVVRQALPSVEHPGFLGIFSLQLGGDVDQDLIVSLQACTVSIDM